MRAARRGAVVPLIVMVVMLLALPGRGQELSGLARLDAAASSLRQDGAALTLDLALSQPVPWRVRVLDAPPRVVLDLREADWTGIAALDRPAAVTAIRAGVFRPGWSRLVLTLDAPMTVARAEMRTGGQVVLALRLEPATAEAFAQAAARPDPPGWAMPEAVEPPPPPAGQGPLVVVIDPGHGGLDPGAEAGDLREADVMLTFARELKEELLRAGGVQVVLTREADVFVPLEMRLSIARAAGADLFLSLHADALAEGEATGATIYTLAAEAEDRAGQMLAERHDRDDLLAGLDLTGQDDLVAQVLMDMARTLTEPRTQRLSDALAAAIRAAELRMHRHPQQAGAFSVLKSPDIPSALIELGFLSSPADRRRLADPAWRARMATALRQGVMAWAEADAAARAAAE